MSTVVVGTIQSNSTSPPTFNNTNGTEIGTLCRAFVNFNGTTVTNPASMTGVRGSFNIASILDNGTGDYTINFTTAMPDANYAVAGSGVDSAGGAVSLETYSTGTILVGSVRVLIRNSGVGVQDNALVSVAIFR